MVLAHVPGKGRLEGLVGALSCRARNGKLFKIGGGFSDAQRASSAAPRVGAVVSYSYFELTNDGIPRFPIFIRIRPDVGADEFEE